MLNCKIKGTVHFCLFKKSYLSPRWHKLLDGGSTHLLALFYQEIVPKMAICSLKPHKHTLNNCTKHIAYISISQQKWRPVQKIDSLLTGVKTHKLFYNINWKHLIWWPYCILRNLLKDSCQVECWSYPKVYQREHYHSHWQDLFLWNIDRTEDGIVI